MLAGMRGPVDSATRMVAGEVYDGRPLFDLIKEDLIQGLKSFADVDVQQTTDEEFDRQLFRLLKVGASGPVGGSVFIHQHARR